MWCEGWEHECKHMCFIIILIFAEYQKKVLTRLAELSMEMKRMGRSEPAASSCHIEQLETMEKFEAEEERLKDKEAFETLV